MTFVRGYRGPIEIAKQFAGSDERPTVIQSELKWKAVVVGAEVHGIVTADDCHLSLTGDGCSKSRS
ncbi:MAG TPA: hypothetical protein VFI31_16965 [Pirellulales bacterium]|nr:hypothetical protein [Pirellulales bacterium]